MFPKKLVLVLTILFLGFIVPSPQNVGANELRLPERREFNELFESGPGNDLILAPGDTLFPGDNELRVVSGDTDVFYSNEDQRFQVDAGLSENDELFLFGQEGVFQFQNDSIKTLSVEWQGTVNDIFSFDGEDNNNTNLLENLVLQRGEAYPFRINVPESQVMEPFLISTELQAQQSFFDLNIHVQTPDGQIFTNSLRSVNTFDELAVPFFPPETGLYDLVIEPLTDDVILDHLAIPNGFNVEPVVNGCSCELSGEDLRVEFFEFFPSDDENTPGILDIDTFVRTPPLIDALSLENDLFGTAEIRVHTPRDPWGSVNPGQVLHDGDTFISIIANPPDDDNPSVKSKKEELGLPRGYDFDVAFWGEFTPLTQLPEGENIFNGNDETDLFFFFDNPTDRILSFNDSETDEFFGSIESFAWFTNRENGDFISANARNNDLWNFQNVDVLLLPQGNYTVALEVPLDSEFRFDFFNYKNETITGQQSINVGTQVHVPEFVFFAANGYTNQLVNFTIPINSNPLNHSATFEVDLFNSHGDAFFSGVCDYDYVEDSNQSIIISNTSCEYDDIRNTNGNWMRIIQTGNTVYNSTTADPLNDDPIEEDVDDLVFAVVLEILDNLDVLSEENPDNDYSFARLSSNINENFNTSKLLIERHFSFTSNSGYNQLLIKATNISIEVVLFVEELNNWFNLVAGATSDGITITSTANLEFATRSPMNFGLILIFDPSDFGLLNGTGYSISVVSSGFITIPELPVKSLSFTPIEGDVINQDTFSTFTPTVDEPFPVIQTIGVTTAIIGGAGITIYIIRSGRFKR